MSGLPIEKDMEPLSYKHDILTEQWLVRRCYLDVYIKPFQISILQNGLTWQAREQTKEHHQQARTDQYDNAIAFLVLHAYMPRQLWASMHKTTLLPLKIWQQSDRRQVSSHVLRGVCTVKKSTYRYD